VELVRVELFAIEVVTSKKAAIEIKGLPEIKTKN